eukprot:TRINITY_DN3506_c0_g1_i1.p1 TRINITY_DN3506_c0_g1~~TRINITY_DN3506_c0_g1_i1.p1  ORF type:complete len:340 (+),score=131.19 TRINITY_DN3506_c0_g1_i1:63-1082(+)
MGKDIFIIDTRCHLNKTMRKMFEKNGYEVEVAEGFSGIPEDVLRRAKGFTALIIFVNKKFKDSDVEILKENENKFILCCSAGFDNIPKHDLLKEAGIRVARVPSYSPSSIAEYAISSMFALSKNIQRSYEMTKMADFRIGGLHCILLEDKTVGIIGTGLIGKKTVQKVAGMVDRVLCYDAYPAEDWIKSVPNASYVDLDTLFAESNIISIHVPLLKETQHLINKDTIAKMKKDVIIINTSRGEIIDTPDLVEGLRSKKIMGVALDVFEGEKAFMFKDMSKTGFENYPELEELVSMDNVIISSHVAFYTDESIRQITEKTYNNFLGFVGKAEVDDKAVVV